MDEMTPDLNTIGVTICLGAVAFAGIAGAVLLARAARPAVERLAEVDLKAVSSAFGDALSQVGENVTRGSFQTPQTSSN